jgi:putative transposase
MFVVAKELVGLPGLPATTKGIRQALSRFSCGCPDLVRKRQGTKALEYHIDCLPEQARELVRQRQYHQVIEQSAGAVVRSPVRASDSLKARKELEVMRKCPVLLDNRVKSLNDQQKRIADARAALVNEVVRLMDTFHETRKAAVEVIATGAQAGTLPEPVQQAAELANARKGATRRGVSIRALQGWVSDYLAASTPAERLAVLAPGKVKAVEPAKLPWLGAFLAFYRQPSRPSVESAYEDFAAAWAAQHAGNEAMMVMMPSIAAVRRALRKIPKAELQRGRVTGAEYKSLLPFIRRDWSTLPVNGAWIGDGHGMKMEAIHPETGKPFKPEITLVIEGPTRLVVGWSLALSESQVAVGDAIRHAVSQYGVPLIYYSDNGGGEKNKVFDADITGIFSRLGIDHQTGIPGNPQARGIIERLNREIPMRVAKKFGSYVGKSGDRETQRVYRKKTDSAVNAIEKGRELTPEQQLYIAKVPTWEQLIAEIEVQVARHNSRPHDSLPKRENGQHWSPQAYRKHLIERDSIEIDYLTSAELHEMFRPEIVRTAVRGEVRVFNNLYFNTELACVEGEKVRVCFDIHDPHSVIIRKMDGTWICDAIWDGNKVDAFPKAHIEKLKEQRVKRRKDRLATQLRRVEEELTPVLEHKENTDFSKFMPLETEEKEVVPRKVSIFHEWDDYLDAGNH